MTVRIAWISPLPPTPSGIADYSADLLPLLAERSDVEVFTEGGGSLDGVTVRPVSELPERGFDATFHHLGNNPHHEFVYRTAASRPGIAVFHDLVLHHLVARFSDGESRHLFEEALEEEHGEAGRRLATLKRVRVAGGFEQFLFPLAGHIARRSLGIVIHGEFARDRLAPIAGAAPIEIIPHHSGVPPREVEGVDRTEARRRLDLPPDAFIVGHIGFLTPEKQPEAVVEGFARLRRERPDALLLVVGSAPEHGGNPLADLAREHGMTEGVRATGFVDVVDFNLALIAADVIVGLRYPSAGETSGTVCRALGHGRPVVVSNYAGFTDFPDEVALKVEIDGEQADGLARHLLHLAEDESFLRDRERRAREYAETVLSPERCRDAYVSLAERVAFGPS